MAKMGGDKGAMDGSRLRLVGDNAVAARFDAKRSASGI